MKWILVVLLVFMVLAKAKEQGLIGPMAGGISDAPAETVVGLDGTPQPSVVMYATKTCGYCAQARRWMTDNNVVWEERDVEVSAAASREMRALGGRGVPTFLVGGDDVIRGWNRPALEDQLR